MKSKVLHIITSLNDGGAEGTLAKLCIGCKNFNHIVISMSGMGKYGPLLENAGVKIYSLNFDKGFKNYINIFTLFTIFRNEKPSIVQTWMYHADILGGCVAKLFRISNIFWNIRHATYKEKGLKSKKHKFIAHIHLFLSKFIPKKIICCAKSCYESHIEIGYCKSKMAIIYNGIDTEKFFYNPLSREMLRRDLGLSQEKIVIGSIGRLHENKGQDNLFKSLKILSDESIDIAYIFAGTNMQKDNPAIKNLIKSNNLSLELIFLGKRNDVPAIMNAIDIHVSASSSEGFPNVIAEAMSCATVAISTNVGDSKYIAESNQCICKANSPSELARLMLTTIKEKNNKKFWDERKFNSRKKIIDNFSLEKMINSYEQIWMNC